MKTENEGEIDERGKGVVFGEFDETDEKHVKELEKQGVAMEDVVSLPPPMAADGCTGAIHSGK